MSPTDGISLLVVVGLPLLSWSLAGARRDPESLAFLFGAVLFSLAVSIFLLLFNVDTDVKTVVIRVLVYCAVLMFLAFTKLRLGGVIQSFFSLGMFSVIAAILISSLQVAIGVYGSVLHHLLLSTLQFVVLVNIRRLWRRDHSRGLVAIGLAMSIVLSTNIGQLIAIGIAGRPFSPELASSPGFWIYAANIICVMLYSVGFWSYSLDTALRAAVDSAVARVQAEERRAAAESQAETLSVIVRERNDMIMINSRFEILNNIGVFNAAVIHDLAQPLQRLMLHADYLKERVSDRRKADELQALSAIQADAQVASGVVSAVRDLLSNSQAPQTWIPAKTLLQATRPIIQSQAVKDGVSLFVDIEDFDADEGVEATPALLDRLILNLVANALQALHSVENKKITISVARELADQTELLRLTVTDNGVGFPKDFVLGSISISPSVERGGMGLGLLISRQIVAMWRGSLSIRRNEPGTEVICRLPLRRRS